jgi:hypothetical protein
MNQRSLPTEGKEYRAVVLRHGVPVDSFHRELLVPLKDLEEIRSLCNRVFDVPSLSPDSLRYWSLSCYQAANFDVSTGK